MLRGLKKSKLFKSFSVYIVANFFNSAIGLLLLPLFTHYLNPDDYGTLSLITTTIAVMSIIIMIGADGSLRREFYNFKGERYALFFTSSLFLCLVSFILLLAVCYFFGSYLLPFIQISEEWLYYSIVISLLTILPTVVMGQYRVEQNAKYYAFYSNAMTVVNMGLGIFLVAVLKMNFEGRGFSLLITNLIFTVIAVFILQKKKLFVTQFNREDANATFRYGLPLVPHQLGALILNYSDRYFIANFVNISATGLYNVGYTVGSIIGKVEGAFTTAYVPFLFEELSKNQLSADKKVVKVSWLFILALLVSTLALYGFSEVLFRYVIDQKYLEAKSFVLIISLGYFFSGCYKMVTGYIFYEKKTIYLTYLAVFNIIINLILNFFLIRNFGAMGAAYATLISFFLMFVITAFIANNVRKMPWFYFIR